jgi:hypothetical protein
MAILSLSVRKSFFLVAIVGFLTLALVYLSNEEVGKVAETATNSFSTRKQQYPSSVPDEVERTGNVKFVDDSNDEEDNEEADVKKDGEESKNETKKEKKADTKSSTHKKDSKKEKEKSSSSSSSSSSKSKKDESSSKTSSSSSSISTTSLSKHDEKKLHFPPIESILSNKTVVNDEENIVGDVRFLLDFAILGHAKVSVRLNCSRYRVLI